MGYTQAPHTHTVAHYNHSSYFPVAWSMLLDDILHHVDHPLYDLALAEHGLCVPLCSSVVSLHFASASLCQRIVQPDIHLHS